VAFRLLYPIAERNVKGQTQSYCVTKIVIDLV
jgi:hypothetical protein